MIGPALWTVTVAVPLDTFGTLVLAVIVVVPTVAPVTGTVAVVLFAAIKTEAGSVTTPAGLALKFTVRAAGVAAESVSVRFCVATPVIVGFCGLKFIAAPTWTAWLPVVYAGADALIVAVPKFTPVICGCVAGCVCLAGIITDAGEIVSVDESLLDSVTVTA